jgi:hypothetical protein
MDGLQIPRANQKLSMVTPIEPIESRISASMVLVKANEFYLLTDLLHSSFVVEGGHVRTNIVMCV